MKVVEHYVSIIEDETEREEIRMSEDKNISIYLASGWFSPRTDDILTKLEDMLRSYPTIDAYFPRHDGVKLSINELHDHALRKRVFLDNINHIDDADFVLANLDCYDEALDTGTMWEVGRAMAKGIPVIAFDMTGNLQERLPGLFEGFYAVFSTYDNLDSYLKEISRQKTHRKSKDKVLFIGPMDTEEQKDNTERLASVISDMYNQRFRWIDDLKHEYIYSKSDSIFEDVEFVVAVIDDRNPMVSWVLGEAYTRGIPIITYTNYDYGVNIMLLCSLLSHVKGIENLKSLLNKIRREGLNSIADYDSSNIKAY